MKYLLSSIVFLMLFSNCQNKSKPKIDVSKIDVNPEFVDFHKQFFNSKPDELGILKEKHPFLFPKEIPDSIWVSKLKHDSEETTLFKMSDSVFGNFDFEKEKIASLFKHLKYYKPNFTTPKTYTLITNLDYENSIIYTGDYLFIALDMYLGRNSEVYQSFPPYISYNYNKEQMIVDIAKKISNKAFPLKKGRTFLETMIYQGKKMFLLQSLLPNNSEKELIGYEDSKLNWTINNEAEIWSYFISNELLYNTDQKLNQRFINTAPFSKFYLDTDNNSPGRIGVWIGWKIVQSYMKNNSVTLLELLKKDAQTIFQKSKYKPKK